MDSRLMSARSLEAGRAGGNGCAYNMAAQETELVIEMFCLHCITINMNILAVITYYSFARR